MASAVVIGTAAFTADLQTVLEVAKGQSVVIDAAAAERLKKESPAPKDFKPEAYESTADADTTAPLSNLEGRAALFCRVISLATGSTKMRPAVVQSLVDMLNSADQLKLQYGSTDAATLQQLASIAAKSLSGVSAEERSVLQSGQAVTLGVAALAIHTAIRALSGATAIASLTAEALQAQVLTDKRRICSTSVYVCTVSGLAEDSCCRSRACLKISMLARQQMMLWVQ